MSFYKETDPLLPKDKGAPEIHGSRAASINDVVVTETDGIEADGQPRSRRGVDDLMAIIFGLFLFGTLALLFSPDSWFDDILGDRRPAPKTVDQRVNRILTDTPLIGSHPD